MVLATPCSWSGSGGRRACRSGTQPWPPPPWPAERGLRPRRRPRLGRARQLRQQKIRTPAIDRLATEGVRSHSTTRQRRLRPSRSVLLTGQHPGHTPIRDNRSCSPRGRSAAQRRGHPGRALQEPGLRDRGDGKWGLGPPAPRATRCGRVRPFFGYNCQRHPNNYYPAYLYDDAGGSRSTTRARSTRRISSGARPRVHPRERGPAVSSTSRPPSPTWRSRCPRTRSPSTAASGLTAVRRGNGYLPHPRRAPLTRRWSPAWTGRSGASSTSSASGGSTSGRSSCSRRTTARPTTASAARTRSFFRSAGPSGAEGSLYEVGSASRNREVDGTGARRPRERACDRLRGLAADAPAAAGAVDPSGRRSTA